MPYAANMTPERRAAHNEYNRKRYHALKLLNKESRNSHEDSEVRRRRSRAQRAALRAAAGNETARADKPRIQVDRNYFPREPRIVCKGCWGMSWVRDECLGCSRCGLPYAPEKMPGHGPLIGSSCNMKGRL